MTMGDLDFAGTERFAIQRQLGAGGMGVVYEARDLVAKAHVALKMLTRLDAHGVERFQREFHALAHLSHRNLVRLGELFCEHGRWFYTMELVDGLDFQAYVRPGAALSEGRLRQALAQLAQGISVLHAAHKVHRDIKPSNVLVSAEGRCVLLDFGLVYELTAESQSSASHAVGTVEYMAPEQAASGSVGPEADWYSVGVMLYQALAGRLPYTGAPLDVLMNKQRYEPPPPSALVEGVPPDLDALCMELLQRDPSSRPTGDAILQRLGAGPRDDAPACAEPKPAFVGRQEELAHLREALREVEGGQTRTVLVHGESGLGKTTLVRQFLDSLAEMERRTLVLSSRCFERESSSYKAWSGILEILCTHLTEVDAVTVAFLLGNDAAALVRVFPILRRVATVVEVAQKGRAVPNPQELRVRAFAAMRELLRRLADDRLVILSLDDLQWADADSLALLREVMHPPGAPALLLVGTVRIDPGAGADPVARLQALKKDLGEVREIAVRGLSFEEGQELAGQLLGSSAKAAELSREAAGHPMLLQELVRHVASVGVESARRVTLDDALWERTQRLETPARELLEVIAVAGAPISMSTVARAVSQKLSSASRWAGILKASHLVRAATLAGLETVQTYHDRVRESVLAHLGQDARRTWHACLAHALETEGAAERNPEVLVRHLEAASQSDRAARWAERAAALAAEALAFEQAADMYRTALRLGQPTPEEARSTRLRLAEALVNAGRGAEAADAYLAAAERAERGLRLDCRCRAAGQLLTSGYIERGLEIVGAVLAELGTRLPRTPRRALLSLLWQRMKLRLRGLRWQEHAEKSIRPHDLTRMDAYRGVSSGLIPVDNVRAADFQARSLLLALRAGEPHRVARALYQEALSESLQGRRKQRRALTLIEEAGRITQVRMDKDPVLVGFDLAARGGVAFFTGDFPRAAETLGAAELHFCEHTTGTAWELGTTRVFRLLSLAYMGSYRQLRQGFDKYVRDAARRGDRYIETTVVRALNVVWLVDDAPADAHQDLDRLSWTPPSMGYHVQHWYELRSRSELDLYEGLGHMTRERRQAEFKGLSQALLLRVQSIRTYAYWLQGRLAITEAWQARASDRALSDAARMARLLDKEHGSYTCVWANLLRAGSATRTTDLVDGLRSAISLADERSMRMCASAARLRLGEALGGDEGAILVAEAEAWMRSEGVKNPASMTHLILPSFLATRSA
jgi:serine/threonine protein kinase